MSGGVAHRHGSDSELLWLWHRTAATTPIGPLAWEPPYASGAALKSGKKKKSSAKIKLTFCCCRKHRMMENSALRKRAAVLLSQGHRTSTPS